MRGQGAHYGDPSANTYTVAQMHHHVAGGQRVDTKPDDFEGRLEAFTPERENPYANSKLEGQWRWKADESKMSNSMTSHMYNEGQGSDASRSYFQGQRPDPKLALQNQSNNDSRSQAPEKDMDVGYEGNHLSRTFEGVEQNYHDDIVKLAKELNDAEDAEHGRHREWWPTVEVVAVVVVVWRVADRGGGGGNGRWSAVVVVATVASGGNGDGGIWWRWVVVVVVGDCHWWLARWAVAFRRGNKKINAINTQYEEKLAALRARHASRRAEFLRRESHVRQQQYQQSIRDPYPSSGMAPRDPHGYSNASATGGETQRGYSSDRFDPYRERTRFIGSAREEGFEPRAQFPGGRVYNTGSRYYN